MRCVLTIAGSDSGGGAGIQADLRAFRYSGVFGLCALTAVTAQNTVGVNGIWVVPKETIQAQVKAIAADFEIAAVKVGMLGDAEAVRDSLGPFDVPIVVDPVMVATSGARLGERDGIVSVLEQADVATPNRDEARELAGFDGPPQELAQAIHELGPKAAVVTGGGDPDIYFDGQATEIDGPKHAGTAHGSGCIHSAVLAAELAKGVVPLEAARKARAVASEAVAHALGIGQGAAVANLEERGSDYHRQKD